MQVLVWTATLEAHLNVLFVLGKIRWSLFEINHGAGVHKWIVGEILAGAEGNSFVGVEGAGEVVAVVDVEDALVELDVDANVQVPPGVA